MKGVLTAILGLAMASSASAEFCKAGDYKDCAAKLKALNQSEKGADFQRKFDEVCLGSKKFKCVKKTVRGEIADEMKYTREERPKANLYSGVVEGENYIYIFELK